MTKLAKMVKHWNSWDCAQSTICLLFSWSLSVVCHHDIFSYSSIKSIYFQMHGTDIDHLKFNCCILIFPHEDSQFNSFTFYNYVIFVSNSFDFYLSWSFSISSFYVATSISFLYMFPKCITKIQDTLLLSTICSYWTYS